MNIEDKILQMLTAINGRLDAMQGDNIELKSDIAELKADLLETKGQVTENTEIIRAILHNQEYTNAKLEGLELTTAKADVCATKEDLRTIENKMNVLNTDLFNQRADIVGLKLVK